MVSRVPSAGPARRAILAGLVVSMLLLSNTITWLLRPEPVSAASASAGIAVGSYHTVGLKTDGTVVAAGAEYYGSCDVENWTGIVQIAAGGVHTVGLRSDGKAVVVGSSYADDYEVDNWTGVVQIAAGQWHALGLRSDGTVVAAGDSYREEVDVGGWTDIVQVAAVGQHSVGLKSDGTVVATGINWYGQCDVGGWTGMVQVAGADWHTLGLKSDGTVVAVGETLGGRCNVGGWTNMVQVAGGFAHSVGLREDGTVVAVGSNDFGECNVGDWTGIVRVAACGRVTLGLESDGTVVATGDNTDGQCNTSSWDLGATPAVTVTGVTAHDKVYDRTLSATLDISTAVLMGVAPEDNVTLITGGARGAFSGKSVGTGKAVAVSGLMLRGPDAGKYFLVQPTTTASITRRPLTVSAVGIDKTYDGSIDASVELLDDRASGDYLTVSYASASFTDRGVGDNKTVSVSSVSISGTDQGNYSLSLTDATTAASITPAELAVAGLAAADKVYDGTTAAALDTSRAALVGVVPGDDVALVTAGATGVFATAEVADANPVTVSGLTLGGADASNYSLRQPGAAASVTPRSPTVAGISASDKPYDGTTAAEIDCTGAVLMGVVPGDDVTLVTSRATGAFTDESVGEGKTVTVSGLALSGADAGNYSLAAATATADITPGGEASPAADAGSANWGLIGGAAAASAVVVGAVAWIVIRRRSA